MSCASSRASPTSTRSGFVRASLVQRLTLTPGEAPALLAVLRFLREQPGQESLGIAYGAAYVQAATAEMLKGPEGIEALAEDLRTVFTAQLLNSDEEAVARMLNHPHSIVSLSDAGAHLTFFNDAGFGLHLLGHWARERNAMSMSEAVRRLTHAPAQLLGIRNRGLIRTGYAADLLLFDPATVARGPKRRVFDLPAGAPRLTTDALGVHGVWVNGAQVADASGLISSAPLAGELLTSFAA